MKIGILTFQNAENYGAVLQCYALQEHLKKLYPNDEICVIDYRNTLIDNSYKSIYVRKSFLQNIAQFLYLPKVLKKKNNFRKFKRNFLNLTHPDFSSFDIIYYGSDQIWNTTLTNGDLTYFGEGFSGKKIAYGASDGGEMQITDDIKSLLSSFDSIFCREISLENKIKNMGISVPISTVLDPVFLLNKNEWLKIAIPPKEKNYILAYKIALRDDFDIQAEKLGMQLGKKVVQIVYLKSIKKYFYKKQKIIQAISPEQFLGYLANADFILTTSFHGTAFSIMFEKPFYVLSFEKRSERITELLNYFGLEKQYVSIL